MPFDVLPPDQMLRSSAASEALPSRADFLKATRRQLRAHLVFISVTTVLGLFSGLALSAWALRHTPGRSTVIVTLSYHGLERGIYPDGSVFQTDDLRRDTLLADALGRQGLDPDAAHVSAVASRLSVEGTVPLLTVHQRDAARAASAHPSLFIPSEYRLTLLEGTALTATAEARETLLAAIGAAFADRFKQTYAQIPAGVGRWLDHLDDADYPAYELVLNSEVGSLQALLQKLAEDAGQFRSPTTGLSFRDLLDQAELFSQIRLSETLGIIYQFGLSRDRDLALSKMDYELKLIAHREQEVIEEQKLVDDLLTLAQERAQNTVLAARSPSAERGTPQVFDQGLIDSLLSNDSYNFLVREALRIGPDAKRIQAERERLFTLRENMKRFVEADRQDQSAGIKLAESSLMNLQVAYRDLLDRLHRTYVDYAEVNFGQAVRIGTPQTLPVRTRHLYFATAIWSLAGLALGVGLALLLPAEVRR